MNGGQPDDTVVIDATLFELLLQFRDASRSVGMWTEYRRELKGQIAKIMGNYTHGNYNGRRVVTVIRTRPKRFNVGAFATDHPALFENYRAVPDEDEIRLNLAKDLPGGGEDE